VRERHAERRRLVEAYAGGGGGKDEGDGREA